MAEGQLALPMADQGVGAVFSECGRYRYRLWRRWADGPPVNFVMLNPSTATELTNDPTVAKCQRWARRWGYPALEVTNIFAFRATDPRELHKLTDPIGEENDQVIIEAAAAADIVICAWGKHGAYLQRGAAVRQMLTVAGIRLHCLASNADGSPGHPLYLKSSLTPTPI